MNGYMKTVLLHVTDVGWMDGSLTYNVETKKSAFSVKNNRPS